MPTPFLSARAVSDGAFFAGNFVLAIKCGKDSWGPALVCCGEAFISLREGYVVKTNFILSSDFAIWDTWFSSNLARAGYGS